MGDIGLSCSVGDRGPVVLVLTVLAGESGPWVVAVEIRMVGDNGDRGLGSWGKGDSFGGGGFLSGAGGGFLRLSLGGSSEPSREVDGNSASLADEGRESSLLGDKIAVSGV